MDIYSSSAQETCNVKNLSYSSWAVLLQAIWQSYQYTKSHHRRFWHMLDLQYCNNVVVGRWRYLSTRWYPWTASFEGRSGKAKGFCRELTISSNSCTRSRPVHYYESDVFVLLLRTITTSMNDLNVLMDKYRTTSSSALLQNGRFTHKKNNETVSNIVCESITHLGVMQANIDMA